jgi:predicted O-linked N-acetylglucosamine transferase (SPINDLY family)
MLEVLEIPELVANDHSEYISISSKLLQDQIFRQDICSKIKNRADLLFGDRSIAEAFELALVRLGSGKKL